MCEGEVELTWLQWQYASMDQETDYKVGREIRGLLIQPLLQYRKPHTIEFK